MAPGEVLIELSPAGELIEVEWVSGHTGLPPIIGQAAAVAVGAAAMAAAAAPAANSGVR